MRLRRSDSGLNAKTPRRSYTGAALPSLLRRGENEVLEYLQGLKELLGTMGANKVLWPSHDAGGHTPVPSFSGLLKAGGAGSKS
jgi:hypothetical protein